MDNRLKNDSAERRTEIFRVPQVSFIAEQDGDVEREFKAQLARQFRSKVSVSEAYLARVRYGQSLELKVALCVAVDGGMEAEIAEIAASEFRTMFKTTESLDVVFLSANQQREISVIGKPFYRQHTAQA